MASPAVDDDLDFAPRHTTEVIGHASAEAEIARAWQSGSMPHAWLLSGPRGIGKATLSYRIARAVLAQSPGGAALFGPAEPGPLRDVAPDHPVFRRVAEQAHPDLCVVQTTVNPKTGRLREEIVVEDARAAIEFFNLTPAEGGWRVAIVDAADELNEESANSLLKVIEEPPQRGLILLVTHRPGFVLPTIRSRCRALRMKPLEADDVAKVLAAKWPELPAEDMPALIAMAEGSPGRAIALAQSDGVGFYRDFVRWMGNLPNVDVALMHKVADRLARREFGAGYRVLAGLPEWGLVRAVRNGAGLPPAAEVVPGEVEVFGRVVRRRNLEHWVGVWEKVSQLLAQGIALNLDRKALALNVLSALGRAAR
ncbi:MAG: DNA polymerase III subunit delta' [Alphaproteobacteria bacterium]|nr:DNA polymerase III subunit delta' [Alphaproteobacteria bacterium]